MRQSKLKLIAMLLPLGLYWSCRHEVSNLEEQAQKARTDITNLLQKLDYKDFEIHTYAHRAKTRTITSKNDDTELFHGTGFPPDGPAGSEPNIPPGYKDRDYLRAYYKKRTIKFNYDPKSSDTEPLEYISAIIIVKKIDDRAAKILEEALEATILNPHRGDMLRIISLSEPGFKKK